MKKIFVIMKSWIKIKLLFAVLGLISIFTACQKQFSPDLQFVQSQILANRIISELFVSAMQYADNNFQFDKSSFSNSVEVNTYWSRSEKRFITTVDFNSYQENGINRNGEIIYKWQKAWKLGLNNSKLQIILKDFEYDGVHVNGKITVQFQDFDDNQNPQFQITVHDLTLTYNDNSKFRFKSNIQATYLNGFYTLFPSDDRIKLSYKEKGISRKNKRFLAVGHELVFDFSKSNFLPISGTEVMNLASKQQILNYGDGQADDKFIIQSSNQTDEFVWKSHQ